MAQNVGYKLYTVADGLVQSEVISLHQDMKGFLWIGTKNGISRFDGHTFQTIRDSAGVSEASVQSIRDLNDSTVLFFTRKGCVLFIYKRHTVSVQSYPIDGSYSGDWVHLGKGFFVTASRKIFQVDLSGIKRIKNSVFDRLDALTKVERWQFMACSKHDGNFYFKTNKGKLACFRKGKIIIMNVNSFNALYTGEDDRIYFQTPNNSLANYRLNMPFRRWDNFSGRLNEPTRLYCVSDTTVSLVADFGMNKEVMNKLFLILNKDTLFLSSSDNSLLMQFIQGKRTDYTLPFPSSGAMMFDTERNLWLGSPMGLVRLHSLSFTHFNENSGLHKNTQIVAEDKYHCIIAGSSDKGIQKLSGNRFMDVPNPDFFGSGLLWYIYPGCSKEQAGNVNISISPYCMITWDGKMLHHVPGLPLTASYSFYEDTLNRTHYCGTDDGLLIRKESIAGYNLVNIFPGNKENKVVSMVKDNSGRLLLGGFKGLSFLEGNKATHLPSEEFPYTQGANAMAKDHRGNIWIGNTKGLWMFDMKRFRKIPNPWFNDLVLSLCPIDTSKLFIGGLHGIGFLDLTAFYKEDSVIIRYFNNDNGFTGNECQQNAVCYDSHGILWVATTDNLQRINPANLPSPGVPPQVYIEKVSLLDETMRAIPLVISSVSNGRLDLVYPAHNIRFDFTAPVYRGPAFVKFRYRLEGQDKDWSPPTTERYAVYTNLSPGNYTFKVIACNDAGIWSMSPAGFDIIIHPALWQTWWFWLIMMILLAAFFFWSGYLVMSRRKKSIQEKLESEKKIAELQLISIRNQIDPHFTFNAMNSIASVILKEEKEKAYSFFVKLSNLIRQVLTSGDKITRTLAEELVFVQNYLEIEKLRFRDSFRFKIDIIQPVNLDQEVPKMVIQTYAENALKHGLLNKKEGMGELIITIREEGKKLHIVVEDNGIGREQAKKLGEKSTGKGMMILNFYYDFFDRYNDQKILHEVTDLYNERHEPAGTKVTVVIPSGFRYKITAHEKNRTD